MLFAIAWNVPSGLQLGMDYYITLSLPSRWQVPNKAVIPDLHLLVEFQRPTQLGIFPHAHNFQIKGFR